ncbi:MAG: hypothetical protein LBL87_07180 [Ruminococcus sp.]|jgi:hypothetical protein|nr:hypothetical protein [Ruminococcus sp.]
MLLDFEKTSALIGEGKLLHIAGTEALLRKLPKGNWIGGSTEYFIEECGGIVTDSQLSVEILDFAEFKVNTYDCGNIENIASDGYENGLTIAVIPFNSGVHTEYADNAPGYADMFIKPVVGWIAGLNLGKSDQTPIAVNGITGEVFTDKAVALSVAMPEGKNAEVKVINIFEQDDDSPVINFTEEGFAVQNCVVDGVTVSFSEYISQNSIDTALPLVGDYSGVGVNVSIKSIENGIVNLYAPVFADIDYRFAVAIPDYEAAFTAKIDEIKSKDCIYACNCILNFLYGNLEGKKLGGFYGAITFGEIAWQLLNQTLVYVTVE